MKKKPKLETVHVMFDGDVLAFLKLIAGKTGLTPANVASVLIAVEVGKWDTGKKK